MHMKDQNLIYIISGQFQYVQNNNLAGSHSSYSMVQIYEITVTKIHDHTHLLRASKGHKHFRILCIISTYPTDTQPEKHSQKKKKYLCFYAISQVHKIPVHYEIQQPNLWELNLLQKEALSGFIRFASIWPALYITLCIFKGHMADKKLCTMLNSISQNSCLPRTLLV